MVMRSTRYLVPAVIGLCVALSAGKASAEAKLPLEKFWIRLEGFIAPGFAHDTTFRVDSVQNGDGTEVSFEDDLGFDTNVLALRADLGYRLGKRHRLNLAYNWVNRGSTHELTRDIIFGDNTYELGADVDAKLDTVDIDLKYGYSFVRNDVAEVGASIGFHVLRVNSSLSVVGSGGGVGGERNSEGNVTAPLPVIGLYGRGAFSSKFFLNGGMQLFAISIDRFGGHFFDLEGTLEYLLAKHFIIGAGYTWNQMEVTQDQGDKRVWVGLIDFTRQGPILTLRYYL
jgi:hypothetical protein